MTATTVTVATKQVTRADLMQAFNGNLRLVRVFEQLLTDIRTNFPVAIDQNLELAGAPFVLASASKLTPNGVVLTQGQGILLKPSTGALTVEIDAPLAVALGGTGAKDAATARGNLGAAASGANSDITSLTGLTTPLAVTEGGTGAATAAAALSNLGGVTAAQAAAAAPVQSVFGRTGNVSAASGDYSVGQVTGAAANGANSDITSLAGLTTPLSTPQGGTGQASFAAHAVVLGAGAGALTDCAPGAAGGMLLSTGATSDPAFGNNPTITGGSIDNTPIGAVTPAAVRGTVFTSASASQAAAASGTAYTLYTFTNTTPAAWLVFANIGQVNDATHYGAFAVVLTDGSSARVAMSNIPSNMTLALSGLALQVSQSSGAAQTINATLTRIG